MNAYMPKEKEGVKNEKSRRVNVNCCGFLITLFGKLNILNIF